MAIYFIAFAQALLEIKMEIKMLITTSKCFTRIQTF